MAAKPVPLTSWTRTLNEEDALTLIDAATPGVTFAEWAALGDRLLPQASLQRRRELLKIVREELLDVSDGTIADSTWLRLFREGSAHRRVGLLYGRLWPRRPLVQRALDALVHPALEKAHRPLAPHDADLLPQEVWDPFLRGCLREDIPHEAFVKTRSTVQSALRDLGVVAISGNRQREVRVRHGRPDPLAFAWLLARELVERGERAESWAIRDAEAARLFAPRPDYAAACVDAGVASGLFLRGHLMGQARLQPGPEMR